MRVLHITAHLGGGVGRVLSRVSIARKKADSHVTDSFICLEAPEKEETLSLMRDNGVEIIICPSPSDLAQLIHDADIVQLEWWHHPLLAEFMCKNTIPARLIVWSHTSGLSYPVIPLEFVHAPHAFLFTAPVSHERIKRQGGIDTVSSSGGFDDIPLIVRGSKEGNLNYCYIGAPNFSKLHPKIIDFLAAVNTSGFQVQFYGDEDANRKLTAQTTANKIVMRGFTSTPYDVLLKSDVLVYLLNPEHYGTTENALLEAMAAGVVPVVLNNSVESSIVRHRVTGMVVDSAKSFSDAIDFLNNNRDSLRNMANTAIEDIRSRFPLESTIKDLNKHYERLMGERKASFNFSSIFGSCPREWFLSCIGQYGKYFWADHGEVLRDERLQHPVLYEKTKSSVFQFLKYFPQEKILQSWADMLRRDMNDDDANKT